MGGVSLVMCSLYPLWHTLRGMFGLSLLFYGEEFSTLAFHIVVFRISGWKKVSGCSAFVAPLDLFPWRRRVSMACSIPDRFGVVLSQRVRFLFFTCCLRWESSLVTCQSI